MATCHSVAEPFGEPFDLLVGPSFNSSESQVLPGLHSSLLLEAPVGFWRLLEASGGFWMLLGASGSFWRLLKAARCFGLLLEASGGFWMLLEALEASGGFWDASRGFCRRRLLETPAGSWRLSGAFWVLLKQAEAGRLAGGRLEAG